MSTSQIVARAAAALWYILPAFFSFAVYIVTMVGETNRLPFDLPEAEGELAGGFHTEYSLAEVRDVLPRRVRQHGHRLRAGHHAVPRRLAGALAASQPSATACSTTAGGAMLWFVVKVVAVHVLLRLAARHAAPRALRPVHALGWKVLIPISLVWLVAVASSARAQRAARRRS